MSGPHRVAIALAAQMSLLEVASAYEVFSMAAARDHYSVKTCGAPSATIGTWLHADLDDDFEGLLSADTVIVPACGDRNRSQPPELIEAVGAAHEAGARVVSICTGAFTLAAAGLLDGRRATTHWRHAARLAQEYPRVEVDPGVLYVDAGTVLTSAGKAAGIDLCLYLIRKDVGPRVANDVARDLVMPPHRDGGQAQFIAPLRATDDDDVMTKVRTWVLDRLDQPLSISDIAAVAHMSPRQLHRRFLATTGVAPLQWLNSQRVFAAQNLLETTDLGVEQIASRIGMGTSTNLRRHFGKHAGVSPDAYRRTFRGESVV
ncbi:GlxA family transcriptional regulator [Nocardia alni]|uniref:GlxA family transcriptional regulator n=1 Tax=Nocardia alni TaxID=2815723 RepID=UPI001C218CBC|nr:helix-turn-helix domain-containing protein [Nocardia alni]